MLKEIKPGYQKQVASVLKWLVYSLRPLYLDEVEEIFILDPDKSVPFDDDDRVFDVLDYLPGMVTKVPVFNHDFWADQITAYEIRFSHFSIKEYLISNRINYKMFSTPEQVSHLHISECCLAYHLKLSKTIKADRDAVEKYVLWMYIAQYCVAHMEQVSFEAWTASLKDRMYSFVARCLFSQDKPSYLINELVDSGERPSSFAVFSSLHLGQC
jgi:hypothetical protein